MLKTLKILVVLLMLSALCAASCEVSVSGKWAYDYEADKVQLRLDADGSAVFEGTKYDWTADDTFIVLTRKNTETKLRYVLNEKGELYIYKTNVYEAASGHKGLIGVWHGVGSNYSFEFTEKGHFLEDRVFPGYYTENAEEGTVKLAYELYFEDTMLYYTIEGDTLTIEYPWRMLRAD